MFSSFHRCFVLRLAVTPKSQLLPPTPIKLSTSPPGALPVGLPHQACSSSWLVFSCENSFPALLGKFLCFSKFQISRKNPVEKLGKQEKNSIILLQELKLYKWHRDVTDLKESIEVQWNVSAGTTDTQSPRLRVIVSETRTGTLRRKAVMI